MKAIYSRKNNITGLIGNELNIETGEWIGQQSGLGAGIDSYFEYLLKVILLSFFSIKINMKIIVILI